VVFEFGRPGISLAGQLGGRGQRPTGPGSLGRLLEHTASVTAVTTAITWASPSGGVTNSTRNVRLPVSTAPGGDLLVTFTHGSGTGLGFTAGNAERPMPALVLAASRFRSVLAAARWSSAAPPTAHPLNLPAALLLNGASTVAGGLWPLPAVDTAAIVAAVVTDIAGGHRAAHRHPSRPLQGAPGGDVALGLAVHVGPASP